MSRPSGILRTHSFETGFLYATQGGRASRPRASLPSPPSGAPWPRNSVAAAFRRSFIRDADLGRGGESSNPLARNPYQRPRRSTRRPSWRPSNVGSMAPARRANRQPCATPLLTAILAAFSAATPQKTTLEPAWVRSSRATIAAIEGPA